MRMLWSGESVIAEGEIVSCHFVQGISNLLESLVLYLAYPFLGDSNNLTDLFKGETGMVFFGFETESMVDYGSFDFCEVGFVARHDMANFRSRLLDVQFTKFFEVIRLFKRWIEVGRESLSILAELHSMSAECLQDCTTGIGGELESPFTVELVD